MKLGLLLAVGVSTVTGALGCGGNDHAAASANFGGTASSSAGGGGSTATGTKLTPPPLEDGLGAYPSSDPAATLGGTMTFTNVGAAGYWARRLNREAGDPGCDLKDGLDSWGGHCCLGRHDTTSTTLAPFDEEMTLLLKMVRVKQLAVYQPSTNDRWSLVSAWDDRTAIAQNLWFTESGAGSTSFPGNLRDRDCVWYVSQAPTFDCGDGRDYFCPDDTGIKHRGWTGSKLIVLLSDFSVDDESVAACSGSGSAHPGPWIAFVASELTRDGARKWNGDCNCYSRTGSVGDGCGEINLFEVVMDGNAWSNREFASTGVRSYQAGHVGGNVCGADCLRSEFPADEDVVDACAKTQFTQGPTLSMDGTATGCPMWLRPQGDRYLVVLLDELRRTVQLALIHPRRIPSSMTALLPAIPSTLGRTTIDALADLRLPQGS